MPRSSLASFPRLKTWLDAGLGFFYPECCQICGCERAGPAEGYVCGRCQSRPDGIRFVRPPFCERCGLPFRGEVTSRFECGNCQESELVFRQARAAIEATALALDLIHKYKYQRALWLEPLLAGLFTSQAAPELRREQWDWIVPVPLHPVRHREREFNQAQRLALPLGAATGIPLNARLLERVEITRTQTMLSRTERAANVRKAFAMRGARQLGGERIVLVDDVLTTGATTNACARALQQAGAGDICVWTLARAVTH